MTGLQKIFLGITVISLSLAVVPLSKLYGAYTNDFYWTHVKYPLTLKDASQNRFMIFIKNEPLQQIIDEGRLFMRMQDKASKIKSADVLCRVNRVHEFVRLDLVLASITLTIAAVFLAMFLIVLLARA